MPEVLRIMQDIPGVFVFPLQPKSKLPYPGFRWRQQSTNDPEKVRAAIANPKYVKANWAIDLGRSGLCVVDIDVKGEHANGMESLEQFPPLESTLVVKTPSGGLHYYFRGNIKNSASKIAPGIDTRGIGGYVVLPGSSDSEGRLYSWVEYNPQDGIPEVPEWVREKTNGIAQPKKPREPLVEEQPHHIELGIRYLLEEAPYAIEGQGGDNTTFLVAANLRDLGLREDTTYRLMMEYWNEQKAHPPWDSVELRRKVRNAYSYAQNQPGERAPEVVFSTEKKDSAQPESPRGAKDSSKVSPHLTVRRADLVTVGDIPTRKWVLGRRYMAEAVTITAAPGGVGKSLLTILESLAVATGREITDELVHKKGPVFLFNGEDPEEELSRRIVAAKIYHKVPDAECSQLYFASGQGVDWRFVVYNQKGSPIVNTPLLNEFKNLLKDSKATLAIFDPLVRFHGVSENDNNAMDLVMRIFYEIATQTGCAVSIVHHVAKSSSAKASAGDATIVRGASSIIAAARLAHTFFPMTPQDARNCGVNPNDAPWYVKLDHAKGNYAPPGESTRWFRKVSVPLFDGDDDPTGVLEPVSFDEVSFQSDTQLLSGLIQEYVEPGNPLTVYEMSKIAHDSGLFKSGRAALEKRILTMLTDEPIAYGANIWCLDSVVSEKGKKTALIVCKDIKQYGVEKVERMFDEMEEEAKTRHGNTTKVHLGEVDKLTPEATRKKKRGRPRKSEKEGAK